MNKRANYTEDALRNAMGAIRDGMPVATASRTFNIPRTTLRHKIAGNAPEGKGKTGPECILGKETEDKLCEWIRQSARVGFPIHKEGLLYSIKKLIEETGQQTPFLNDTPGKKWFRQFMKRHPDLSYKQTEYLNKARSCITESKIRNWFSETLGHLGEDARILEEPSRIWNMDETSFYLNPKGSCVLAEKGKSVYGVSSNSDKENVTTLITVNAVGEFAPPLTLYKFERIPIAYMKAAPKGWGIGKSKNGWMTAETFLQYFENVFYPYLTKKGTAFPVLVFLDGHTSHLTLELSRFCKEKQIIIVCLYPNTTHILQPLDVSVFFPLKTKWRKVLQMWRIEHEGEEIKKKDVPTVLHKILHEHSFTEAVVNGFRVCGLFPFDPNNVDYSKCTQKGKTTQEIIDKQEKIETNLEEGHLSFLEKRIGTEVLDEFKRCSKNDTLPKNKESHMLFNFWLELNNDNEASKQNQIIDNIIEFDFPEFDENIYNLTEGSNKNIIVEVMDNIQSEEELELEKLFIPVRAATSPGGKTIFGEINQNILTVENQIFREDKVEGENDVNMHKLPNCDKEPLILTEKKQSLGEDNVESENNENTHTLTNCDTEPLPGTSYKNECDKENNITNLKEIKIISNLLLIPSQKEQTTKVKRNREQFISVLTSEEWLKREEMKEAKKIEQEQLKESKRKVREDKARQVKLNKAERKQKNAAKNRITEKDTSLNNEEENKRGEIEKTENDENVKVEAETEDKDIGNKVKQYKRTIENDSKGTKIKRYKGTITESEVISSQGIETADEYEQNNKASDKTEQMESKLNNSETAKVRKAQERRDILKKDEFVIVRYEDSFYPGRIIKMLEHDSYLVSTMTRSSSDWKWPSRKDELPYDSEDIIEVILTPVKKNNRGTFYVPEMKKYLEQTIC